MNTKFLTIILVLTSIFYISSDLTAQNAAQSNIKVLSESNFKASIKSGVYLVDFYADWCRPCKMMKPILEEVAVEHKSKITVAQINTDYNKNLSTQYNISGIPCMIVFKDGKEVKRIIGYHEKTQLLEKLSEYIN